MSISCSEHFTAERPPHMAGDPRRERHRRAPFSASSVAVILAVVMPAVAAGCRSERSAATNRAAESTKARQQPQRDYFGLAIDFLKQRDEHNPDRAAREASFYLNRWMRDQAADPRWFIDRRLINTLPLAIRTAPATKDLTSDKSLAQLQFNTVDVLYLEETRWLRGAATWVTEKRPTGSLSAWLRKAKVPPKTGRDLKAGMQLFDWTVRNIQLDELLPYPKETAAGPLSGPSANDPTVGWPPPMKGIPGPGYTYFPWHVMLYGRGDAWQRARVFILLLRQLHIDAVMLGIDTKTGRARPWLPAVASGDQLYLFDAALGLPIPGPGGEGIAALSQVIDDPSLLTSLDISDKHQYPVRESDLDKVVALIDATPEALSQRMALVESQLDAANQMVLSVSPSALKRKLDKCAGVKDVRLWAVPYEALMYQEAHLAIVARNMQARRQEFLEHGIFQGLSTLVKARRQYFMGRIENQDDQPGATTYYLQTRTPNAHIEAIGKSREAQAAVGLIRPPGMSDVEWQGRLMAEQQLRIQAKRCASYFLGLVHFEQGDYDIAARWFQKRTLEAAPDGPWRDGARYNLARCYEALGQPQKASRLYLIDESPQRFGNLLRARRLEEQAKTPAETAPEPPAD